MTTECPVCGRDFSRLGQHWVYHPEHRPSISDEHHEIITGVLMSDGCIPSSTKNPFLQMGTKNKEYLEYIDSIFGPLGSGVSQGDWSFNWRTTTHPELSQYRNWYESGVKVWPDHIRLTPTTLKHLYCGDGTFYTSGYNRNIKISMVNERDNSDKVRKIFRQAGLPEPSFYSGDRPDGRSWFSAYFDKPSTNTLFDYMGSPPPGFEYKWPDKTVK